MHHHADIRLDGLAQPDSTHRNETLTLVNHWITNHPEFLLHTVDRPPGGSWHGRWVGVVRSFDGGTLNDELLKSGLVGRL